MDLLLHRGQLPFLARHSLLQVSNCGVHCSDCGRTQKQAHALWHMRGLVGMHNLDLGLCGVCD